MIKNILLIALRNFKRDIGYSLLNILGLTIGITFSLFLIFYVKDELDFDRHFDHAERIYRIQADIQEPDNKMHWASTQIPLGPTLQRDFPEVEQAVRFISKERTLFKNGDATHFETKLYYADSNVFKVFSQKFIEGSPTQALIEPNSVVISKKIALKYFGTSEGVLGKTLQTASNDLYKVTGVIEDPLPNTHIRYDLLLSVSTLPANFQNGGWGGFNNYTYVLLGPATTAAQLEEKLLPMYDKYMAPIFAQYNIKIQYKVQPITDIHLHSTVQGEPEELGSMSYIWIFSSVAFFMLLIACINYMNLTTARSARRAKEIGIRKVTGSSRSLLVAQFLSESILTAFLAVLVSALLVLVMMSTFNSISGKSFSFHSLIEPGNLALLFFIALFTGLVSGSYPAFYLSSFRPISILKGMLSKASGNVNLRQSLVVVQFAISMIMLICTWVVYNQLSFLRNRDLGFDKEQVMTVTINTGKDERSIIYALNNELRSIPGVKSVGTGNSYPGSGSSFNLFTVESKNGKLDKGIDCYGIDENYLPTLNIPIVNGRNFSGSDTLHSILVNESMAREFGWGDQPLGKRVTFPGDSSGNYLEVVGVFKDFNQKSLYNPIAPLLLFYNANCNIVQVKIEEASMAPTILKVEQMWTKYFPQLPFEYKFLDDDYNSQYVADEKRGKIFAAFSILTILITCLGLLGLTAFTTQQKQKEISMRRILGASIFQVVSMITRSYISLAIIACLIAFPVAWYFMSNWLKIFTYHQDMTFLPFILSAFVILITASLTAIYHSSKAALTKPATTLRTE